MTKTKSTKRALLLSALSLLMCVSMLIGSTFAWFTDDASSAVNTIQAGTLEVELQKYTDGLWGNAEGQTIAFRPQQGDADDILWEPGCTFVTEQIRIVNKGDLALKFDLVVSGGVTKKDGTDSAVNLMEALEITYDIFTTAGDGTTGVAVTESNGTIKGNLKANETSNMIQIRVHMKEDAGNEYQGLKLEGLTVAVSAQQLSHEYDSFGNYYDAGIEALAGAWVQDAGTRTQIGVEITNIKGITDVNSFYINILDANGNVITKITPTQKTINNYVTDGVLSGITACAIISGANSSSWDNTVFTPDANNAPVKAVLFVNGVEKGSCDITQSIAWADAIVMY